jgi:hypothetical protein
MNDELLQKIERLELQVEALTNERIPKVDRASRHRDRRQIVSGFGLFAVALLIAGTMSASALSGTNTVDSGDIKAGEVKGSDIAADVVTGAKVKDGSLTGDDLAFESVDEYKLDINFCGVSTTGTSTPNLTRRCFGVASADATRQAAGVYCVNLPRSVVSGSVTIDGGASGFPVAYLQVGASSGCPSGTDATVTTYRLTVPGGAGNATGTLTDEAWHGLFF